MHGALMLRDTREIDKIITSYKSKLAQINIVATTFYNFLAEDPGVRGRLHSAKYRVKDPEHLRNKLIRKAVACREAGRDPKINCDNFYTEITDLAGVRLLYLRPGAIIELLPEVLRVLDQFHCIVAEEPFAYTWDRDQELMFQKMGLRTEVRHDEYTSIHLVARLNSEHFCGCEIQIRTLVDEVWAEVSHLVDYPRRTESIACQSQLKVLARLASSKTRLVDAIFSSAEEYELLRKKQASKKQVPKKRASKKRS